MAEMKIAPFRQVVPMIYAYNTPGVAYHEGWTKIGYTEQGIDRRIEEQTHTAGIRWEIAWQDNAMYKDGSGDYFRDTDFHAFLMGEGVEREKHPRTGRYTEWFRINGTQSRRAFDRFARRELPRDQGEHSTYTLRREQQEAVEMTRAWFEKGGDEFLWNAKPRFGKTLSAYALVEQMNCQSVLVVTNRPSIANSWAEDFRRFIAWKGERAFVSDTEALEDQPGVLPRDIYVNASLAGTAPKRMVAFESLQGLKGSVYFGGAYRKLEWIRDMEFDLLIVDEAHEGVDTMKTERAFKNIRRKHTLYLSGTPFKALASEQFGEDQLYNWSYADEQEAKLSWDSEDSNPYETLPRLLMYTYQVSPMIEQQLQRGIDLDDEAGAEYAFDLNEFFSTDEKGRFVHEEDVRKFLHALTTQEKYPFSTEALREELAHTLWLLDRVASAKALARMLMSEEFAPIFGSYEIVLAAGDGRLDGDRAAEDAYQRVKTAIATHERTITLSVGQLTVGVTIPEWSGVLMLCNMKSPASYMQAAFRVQNPCLTRRGKRMLRKENAYVFDFDPARTLIIFDEFANNLSPQMAAGRGTGEERKEHIRRLLNFFPVIGEDRDGRMVELDAAQVLSIPRRIKSQEVVRRGFMSNFLFQNIGSVFNAPAGVRAILEKLVPAQEETRSRDHSLPDFSDVPVDENGDVAISKEVVIGKSKELFGQKRYEEVAPDVDAAVATLTGTPPKAVTDQLGHVSEAVKKTIRDQFLAPAVENYKLKKGAAKRLESEINREIDRKISELGGDFQQQFNIARIHMEEAQRNAETVAEAQHAEAVFTEQVQSALGGLVESVKDYAKETIENKPQELVETLEKNQALERKRADEDVVRAHLRGFSRTIPSFVMAYGDENLKLSNLDLYTEPDVFENVTGITLDDFRVLRDGGYVKNEKGELEYAAGHYFDEIVFNDSILEFLNKKADLADYFDEHQKEDIFDYIPPQRTNQIFTPRAVVSRMVDALEENNPGCFDDPNHTFADLYMKSGLYITEIVKRLFRSEKMKALYPDDGERIRHILRHQVYGMAPTRIIYLIAMNYILGFDKELHAEALHFVEADAAAAAKNGTLGALVKKYFG